MATYRPDARRQAAPDGVRQQRQASSCCSSSRTTATRRSSATSTSARSSIACTRRGAASSATSVDQDVDVAVGYLNADFGLGEAFKFNLTGNDIYERSRVARARDRQRAPDRRPRPVRSCPASSPTSARRPSRAKATPTPTPTASTFSNRDSITAKDDFFVVQPAVYLESDITLGAAGCSCSAAAPTTSPRSTRTRTTRAARCTTR